LSLLLRALRLLPILRLPLLLGLPTTRRLLGLSRRLLLGPLTMLLRLLTPHLLLRLSLLWLPRLLAMLLLLTARLLLGLSLLRLLRPCTLLSLLLLTARLLRGLSLLRLGPLTALLLLLGLLLLRLLTMLLRLLTMHPFLGLSLPLRLRPLTVLLLLLLRSLTILPLLGLSVFLVSRFLSVVLGARRDRRSEKQEDGSRAGRSHEFHDIDSYPSVSTGTPAASQRHRTKPTEPNLYKVPVNVTYIT
jgi:hypothetical protein